jgi:hypothetical protein
MPQMLSAHPVATSSPAFPAAANHFRANTLEGTDHEEIDRQFKEAAATECIRRVDRQQARRHADHQWQEETLGKRMAGC